MLTSHKNHPSRSIPYLIILLLSIKLTAALPAPRPFAFPQVPSGGSSGGSNPTLGNPEISANSWCVANSDQAIAVSLSSASEYARTAMHTDRPETAAPTAIFFGDGISAIAAKPTTTPAAKQATANMEPGSLSSGNITLDTANSGGETTDKTNDRGVLATGTDSNALISKLKRLFRRQTAIQPSDPCRHPNPNFPDEGGPNVVTGCNTNPLAPDGTCPHKDFNEDCTAYCETRREFYYGKEQRWTPAQEIFPYPDAPTISISKGQSITIGRSWDIGFGLDPNLLGGLVLGTGLGFSKSWTWTTVRTFSSPAWNIMYPYCGFFTFLPKMVRSCGILTQWDLQSIVQPMGATIQTCTWDKAPKISKEVCAETPWRDADGNTEGVLIVVKVVCGAEQTLAPPCQQDKLYVLPDVMDTSLVGWNMTNDEVQRWVKYSSPS
ncbi:hypothetical protein AA313_de0204076 [Arthrobotrys entomopaga]|nr:hypothetical protein AA313_de0204076 [Arthrobotrys entomopaga]